MFVRTEAILTQLIFEHALRIRMKSDAGESKGKEDSPSTGEGSSPTTSATEISTASEDNSSSDSGTLRAQEADSISTDAQKKTESTSKATLASSKKPDAINLVGKINNLVTTDLQNIISACEFGMLVVYIPIEVVLCIAFLYAVLGWRCVTSNLHAYYAHLVCLLSSSSFVGLACIIVLTPIPGYLTKLLQDVQKTKMKKTDARVQAVTESACVCYAESFLVLNSLFDSDERLAHDQNVWMGTTHERENCRDPG
jgi:hypothetical protein